MSDAYSVVVTGKINEGFELSQVKANVAQLFKLKAGQVEKLFAGKPVAVRRGIGKEQALKTCSALARAGAVAMIKPVSAAAPSAAEAAPVAAKAAVKEDIECPRCGYLQQQAASCVECGVDLRLQIKRYQRKQKMQAFRLQSR